MGNNEVKRIANILFNMSLDMDYDTFVDDYKEDMEMLTESIGNLSKEDDLLFHVLQTTMRKWKINLSTQMDLLINQMSILS